MTGLEAVTAVGATAAVLKAVPPAADAGKRFLDVLGRKELTQTRRERDDARQELAVSKYWASTLERELERDAEVIDKLADEVITTQAELTDAKTEFDDYRETMQLVMWGGGAVILVLLLVIVLTSVRHT